MQPVHLRCYQRISERRPLLHHTEDFAQAHAWLTPDANGRPALRFHPRCVHAIRTIPALTYSRERPEDVSSDGEDHAYDSMCLWLSSRPQRPAPVTPTDRTDRHPGLEARYRHLEQYWRQFEETRTVQRSRYKPHGMQKLAE